jgi:hypothetical protein
MGLTCKSLFSENGYYLLSIGKTASSWVADVYNKKKVIKTLISPETILKLTIS